MELKLSDIVTREAVDCSKDITIHVPQEEDYHKLMDHCEAEGIGWVSGALATDYDAWNNYKEDTCIFIERERFGDNINLLCGYCGIPAITEGALCYLYQDGELMFNPSKEPSHNEDIVESYTGYRFNTDKLGVGDVLRIEAFTPEYSDPPYLNNHMITDLNEDTLRTVVGYREDLIDISEIRDGSIRIVDVIRRG